MAINFPSAPTNGQTHTDGGITWAYNSSKGAWLTSTSGTFTVHTHAQSDITNLVTDLAAKAAHATVLTAGAGLTGGGDLSAGRTFNVGAGTGITVNADDVAITIHSQAEAEAGTDNTKVMTALRTAQAIAALGGTAASQAEQEAGSSTTKFTTPGRQHFHPSAAKFWANIAGAGVLTSSYNVTSITDTGVGRVTVTIGTDFSSADWACMAMVLASVDAATTGTPDFNNKTAHVVAQAAGTCEIDCLLWGISDNDVVAQFVEFSDPVTYYVVGFGDHA